MKVRRRRSGEYSVDLDPWHKQFLAALVPQLRELLLDGSSPDLRRLYPTAYPDDAEADEAYGSLVHDQLLEARLDALDVLESRIDESRISEEELEKWMMAVNSIRLVIGTRLDVSEEDDFSGLDGEDPDRELWIAYYLLGEMLAVIVDALDRG